MHKLLLNFLSLLPFATLGLLFTGAQPVQASHFRYGQLSSQRITGNTVRFDLFAAFRRNGYSGTAPDGLPKIGDVITETIGATGIQFGDSGFTGTLRFVILNIDTTAGWLYGAALEPGGSTQGVTHTYSNAGPWTAFLDTCCRISNSVNAGDLSYRVETIVNLNKTNVSPTSTLPIIVQCTTLTTCNFPVPAADPDAQLLSFRLATQAESYLTPLPSLSITSAGLATFNAPPLVGSNLYSAQFVVEKRNKLNAADLLSKISVDFLIQVVAGGPVLGNNPSFQSPTPSCGQTINLQAAQPLSFTVSARSNNAGGNVTLNAVGQPLGSTFSPTLPVNGAPSINSLFSFTPTSGQAGQQFQMNLTATDEGGRQSTCAFAILVIAPNTVVRLNPTRSGARMRFQWLVSGSLCSTPTYTLRKSVAPGGFVDLLTTTATAALDNLTGPAGTLNEYVVTMSFANSCAPPTQSNIVSAIF